MSLSYETTWDDVIKNNKISLIEDPVIAVKLPKEQFYECYAGVLDNFNGEYDDCFMNLYFEYDCIQPDTLLFIDSEKKENFFKFAEELGITDTLWEIHKGETNEDEKTRKKREKDKEK